MRNPDLPGQDKSSLEVFEELNISDEHVNMVRYYICVSFSF